MQIVVEMTRLDKLIAHDVDNFSVTVQAGMRLGQLQQVLKGHYQFLSLDPPGDATATLGGIAAANVAGPWKLAFGSARDLVLGMKLALADGRLVSFGGKTMKNVAGYDVGKLLIGSQGTLGAICELTFRLYSLPEETRSMLLPAPGAAEAFSLAHKALSWSPSAALVLSPAAAKLLRDTIGTALPEDDWLVAVDLMGDKAPLVRQQQEIAAGCGKAAALEGEARQMLWEHIRMLLLPKQSQSVVGRAGLPLSATEKFVNCRQENTAKLNPADYLIACPGTGRVWVQFNTDDLQIAMQVVNSLRASAQALEGHFMLEAAPEDWQSQLPMSAEAPAHISVLQAIKRAFDPAGILSPGRFLEEV
jgi:glycolate oxidase FAD binding subunit